MGGLHHTFCLRPPNVYRASPPLTQRMDNTKTTLETTMEKLTEKKILPSVWVEKKKLTKCVYTSRKEVVKCNYLLEPFSESKFYLPSNWMYMLYCLYSLYNLSGLHAAGIQTDSSIHNPFPTFNHR